MTRLLTRNIATMTEMREPQKVLDRANGEPVAILKNSALVGYFVPVAYVEAHDLATMEDLLGHLRHRAYQAPGHFPEEEAAKAPSGVRE